MSTYQLGPVPTPAARALEGDVGGKGQTDGSVIYDGQGGTFIDPAAVARLRKSAVY